MYDWKEMQRKLRTVPFEAFQIRLTDGRVLDMLEPELKLVTPLRMVIGIPDDERPDSGIAKSTFFVNWDEIAEVQPKRKSAIHR